MTVYDAQYMKDDALLLEFNLDGIDEVYRHLHDKTLFIFKVESIYYRDNYNPDSDRSLLMTNNKILKFSKSIDDDNYVNVFYKFNAYLTKAFGVDIYQYSSINYKGTGKPSFSLHGFYYVIEGVAYMSEYPFASMNEIIIQNYDIFQKGIYTYSDSKGYAEISEGIMTRHGGWADEIFISGTQNGVIRVPKDIMSLQAMATTPEIIDIAEYLNTFSGGGTQEYNKIGYRIYSSDELAGIYESPVGSEFRIGFELWEYTEIIDEKPVIKTVRKNIELFRNAENLYQWTIDDYATATQPYYSNSPQTLTRSSDGATIEIEFVKYTSSEEKIPICEGQAWR